MTIPRVFYRLILTIFLIIFVFASAMMTLENNETIRMTKEGIEHGRSLYQIHDMLYYMVVTMTTVGYGDISPTTFQGQMLFVLIEIVVFSALPMQISEFSKVNSLTSEYARAVYQQQRRDVKHILLIGDSQPDAIRTFLKECFHSDHGAAETDVVIMRTEPPTDEIKQIISESQSEFESTVFYLQGNPLNHNDLERAQAQFATCAVIMANQFCNNHQTEDYKNILSAFAIKNFVRQHAASHNNREMRICLQISKPEHKDLYYSGLTRSQKVD